MSKGIKVGDQCRHRCQESSEYKKDDRFDLVALDKEKIWFSRGFADAGEPG